MTWLSWTTCRIRSVRSMYIRMLMYTSSSGVENPGAIKAWLHGCLSEGWLGVTVLGLPLMILNVLGGRNLNSWGAILQLVRKDNFVSVIIVSLLRPKRPFIQNTSTLFQIRLDIRVFLSK